MRLATKITDYFIIPGLFLLVLFLYLSTPKFSGSVKVNRNYNSISIKRDAYGRAVIEGKEIWDAYYGLGYAQGQDRLWQIYFKKMLIAGRISELFGEKYIKLDKFMRNLAFTRYSNYSIEHVDKVTVKSMQAFCDGLNDAVQSYLFYPVEFYINGAEWDNYTVVDYIASTRFVSLLMTKNAFEELVKYDFDERIGKEMTDVLLPLNIEDFIWKTTIMDDDDLKYMGMYQKKSDSNSVIDGIPFEDFPEERRPYSNVDSESKRDTKPSATSSSSSKKKEKGSSDKKNVKKDENIDIDSFSSRIDGSNVFVIHGNYTMTGKPVLASDPHLQKTIPSFWYQATVSYSENYLTAAFIAGSGMAPIGRTKYISWGVAVANSDASDIYELTTRNENEYFHDGSWRKMREYKEQIFVKGRSVPENFSVYETHHGIVVDYYQKGVFWEFSTPPKEGKRFALAWTGFVKNDKSDNVPIKLLSEVKTAEDMVNMIFQNCHMPPLALLFASEEGDIGYTLMSRVPKRRDTSKANRVQDGSLKENDWYGLIPFEHHPHIINPSKGYLIAANNKPTTDNTVFGSGANVQLTARQARLEELIDQHIDSRMKFSTEDIMQIQLDTIDPLARKIIPVLFNAFNDAKRLQLLSDDEWTPKIAQMIDYLRHWNFKMRRESVASSIFNVWQLFFYQFLMTCHHNLTVEEQNMIIELSKFENFAYKKVLSLTKESFYGNQYCIFEDDVYIEDEPCLYGIMNALALTWEFLETTTGKDIDHWAWGDIQIIHYRHLFSDTPLRFLYHRSSPGMGNSRTVSVNYPKFENERVSSNSGPTLRFIANMDEDNPSYFISDTGSSGIFTSSHYDDQLILFERDEYLEAPLPSIENWIDLLNIEMIE